MYLAPHSYTTKGSIFVSRTVEKISAQAAIEEVLLRLDSKEEVY